VRRIRCDLGVASRRLQSPVRKRWVVARVDEGSGPLPGALGALGALGARAVTVCRVLTLRLVVLGKSCDFSDEILRTRAMDSGQFELGA
jgi:hypothetical protein